jgi:hypothetical protein
LKYPTIISALLALLLLIAGCEAPNGEVENNDRFCLPQKIVVDWSPYQDLQSAAGAEDTIDWNDAGTQNQQRACTLSFAALELKQHLAQALASDIAVSLPEDVNGEPSVILMLASNPDIDGFLSAEEVLEAEGLPTQGYMIIPKAPHLVITGSAPAGILYGVYGLLEELGFRWFAPSSLWAYIPNIYKDTEQQWQKTREIPSFEFRGFWNYDSPSHDFTLWAVRNRFNLIGCVEPQLAAKLGLNLWAGSHSVIQKALTSDPSLFQTHPEWFGLKKGERQPIQTQGSYFNPCFSNVDMANYIADYITNQVEAGDYQDTPIMVISPADSRTDSYYCQCEECQALGNPTNQLLFFYNNILNRLQYLKNSGQTEKHIKICGYSYYATWALPDSEYIEALGEDYLHVFCLNQRSFSEPVFTENHQCENNAQIAQAMEQWLELGEQTEIKFGVCEYYNYSIYGGLAETFQDVIATDLKAYHDLGCDLFAYMHPLEGDPGLFRLTNRLLSSLTWDVEAAGAEIAQDYFLKMYPGIEDEVGQVYLLLDSALSNVKEMFGQDSLSYNLFQECYWASPPYTTSQIMEHIPRYLEGGNQLLPGEFSAIPDYNVSFVGLRQSMNQLEQCLTQLEELYQSPDLDSETRQRLEADIEWCRCSYYRYSLLSSLAEWRLLRTSSPDSPQLELLEQEFEQALNFLKNTPLLDQTISKVAQREAAIGCAENTRVIRPY